MLADPTITISGSAKTLNRTSMGMDTGAFATSARDHHLSVAHSYGRRTRRVIKLKVTGLVANPLIAGQNINQEASVHLVVDTPNGYDTATAKAIADGFLAYLSASSGAVLTKLVGGES